MNRIAAYLNTANLVGLTIGYWLTDKAKKFVDAYQSSKSCEVFILVTMLLLVLLFINITKSFLLYLLDDYDCVRKFVLGKHYIEGYWFDKVVIGNKNYCGIFAISLSGEHFVVRGQQYDEKGRRTKFWESRSATYDFKNQQLCFVYHVSDDKDGGMKKITGFSTYSFLGEGFSSIPNAFKGTYADISDKNNRNEFKGNRIVDNNLIKRLLDRATEKNAVLQLMESL